MFFDNTLFFLNPGSVQRPRSIAGYCKLLFVSTCRKWRAFPSWQTSERLYDSAVVNAERFNENGEERRFSTFRTVTDKNIHTL